MISGIPDPAASGAKFVTIYTDEKTRTKLINTYTKNPATYDFCIIEKVNANFQPAKFSTERFMKTAANPVPEKKRSSKGNQIYSKTIYIT